MKKLIIPALLALAVTGALTLGGCPIEDVEDFLVIPWKSEVKHLGVSVLKKDTTSEALDADPPVYAAETLYKASSGGTEILVDNPNSHIFYVTNNPDRESVAGDTVDDSGVIVKCIHGRKVYVGE
ncbi:MAG: hypothetical protein MdMp014T_1465 [Treponematales bacterium]